MHSVREVLHYITVKLRKIYIHGNALLPFVRSKNAMGYRIT